MRQQIRRQRVTCDPGRRALCCAGEAAGVRRDATQISGGVLICLFGAYLLMTIGAAWRPPKIPLSASAIGAWATAPKDSLFENDSFDFPVFHNVIGVRHAVHVGESRLPFLAVNILIPHNSVGEQKLVSLLNCLDLRFCQRSIPRRQRNGEAPFILRNQQNVFWRKVAIFGVWGPVSGIPIAADVMHGDSRYSGWRFPNILNLRWKAVGHWPSAQLSFWDRVSSLPFREKLWRPLIWSDRNPSSFNIDYSSKLSLDDPENTPRNQAVNCRDVYDDPFGSLKLWQRFLCAGLFLAVGFSISLWGIVNNHMHWWGWLLGIWPCMAEN